MYRRESTIYAAGREARKGKKYERERERERETSEKEKKKKKREKKHKETVATQGRVAFRKLKSFAVNDSYAEGGHPRRWRVGGKVAEERERDRESARFRVGRSSQEQ